MDQLKNSLPQSNIESNVGALDVSPGILPTLSEDTSSRDDTVILQMPSTVDETFPQHPTTVPPSPSSTTHHVFSSAFDVPGRIFTDLFSGYDSPLSSAILSRNCKVFRMDILIDAAMDIFLMIFMNSYCVFVLVANQRTSHALLAAVNIPG